MTRMSPGSDRLDAVSPLEVGAMLGAKNGQHTCATRVRRARERDDLDLGVFATNVARPRVGPLTGGIVHTRTIPLAACPLVPFVLVSGCCFQARNALTFGEGADNGQTGMNHQLVGSLYVGDDSLSVYVRGNLDGRGIDVILNEDPATLQTFVSSEALAAQIGLARHAIALRHVRIRDVWSVRFEHARTDGRTAAERVKGTAATRNSLQIAS